MFESLNWTLLVTYHCPLTDYSRRIVTTTVYVRPVDPVFPKTTPVIKYEPPDRSRPKQNNRNGIGRNRHGGKLSKYVLNER